MIYAALCVGAVVAMRYVRYVRYAPYAAPVLLLIAYACKRTVITAIGAWLAAGIVAAILWKDDRG